MGLLIRLLRDLRLVPLVLAATIALFALKSFGLILDGGYLFQNVADDPDDVEITGAIAEPARSAAGEPPAVSNPSAKPALKPTPGQSPKQSWAQEMFNYPGGSAPASASPPELPRISFAPRQTDLPSLDVTGAVAETPVPAKEDKPAGGESPAKKMPQEVPPAPSGTPIPVDIDHPVSPAERAVLESLQKRRTELDARAHDLDMREDLLRAAEKRVGGRIEELKELEARIGAALQQRDEGEAQRFKNVVTMYETMKAKDAAKIFDGLDIKVLIDVARHINPRNMSEILAQMTPEKAQRLTTELAAPPAPMDHPTEMDLPKIQGRPAAN